ncbi:hypothetical protein [Nostoc sp.]|uniref:hypothetical protein n=1 Tax=Nostoc sp. TaxID=1180 RepID=UPI002FF6C9AA
MVFRSAQTSLRPRTDYLRRSATAHCAIAVGELIPFLIFSPHEKILGLALYQALCKDNSTQNTVILSIYRI